MLISSIQILNYKSFRDSGVIEFRPGINIITGQNSAGKTALLEAITLDFQNVPHKSISTLPTRSSPINSQSKVKFSLHFTEQEVREIVAQLPKPYSIPQAASIEMPETIQLFQAWLDNPQPLTYSLSIEGNSNLIFNNFSNTLLSFGLYEPVQVLSGACLHHQLQHDENGQLIAVSSNNPPLNQSVSSIFFMIARNRIYRFLAERLNVSSCSRIYSWELSPNASNLPEVLGILQGENPELFNLLNSYVSIVFPQIKRVTVSQVSSNVEIKVWYIDTSTYRDDLAFPLSACGTGVGQVLAILYVVLTAQNPRVFLIDEPQSFLHPGAAKKLIEILRELGKNSNFSKHQYIISTHSPTVIASAEPTNIVMLRYIESCETAVSVMNSEDTRQLKFLLDEVGARLSDVFGMDQIFWVEGPTEEKCYPLIIKEIIKKPLRGIQILAIKNTGDLEGKRAHVIFDVYDKLSGGQNLFPPAIGFLFDKELRTPQEIEDLQKRSSNPVKFLPRRMYENYLLNSKAIANILNELDEYRENPISASDINELLNDFRHKKDYFSKNPSDENLSDEQWVDIHIDGARVLKDIFSKLSEGRVEFSKTRDSVKLTEWLIENEATSLKEISDLLNEILPKT
ncbi:MAG TPA: AAA family ATPase [Halomicronema sp.]